MKAVRFMCNKCGARLQLGDGLVFWDIGDWWHVPCTRVFFMNYKGNRCYASLLSDEGKLVEAPLDSQ